jgi:ABC-type amino acid transport substrate-binding protein
MSVSVTTILPTATWGVLTVGIDDSPPPPMEIGDPASPDFDGYEVDILKGVSRHLGLELRYRRAAWSEILDQLANGVLDVVCTAATYTPERAQEFDYGRPYLEMALSVVVRDDVTAPRTLDDARGRAFAVRVATTAEAYIGSQLQASSLHRFDYNSETSCRHLDLRPLPPHGNQPGHDRPPLRPPRSRRTRARDQAARQL